MKTEESEAFRKQFCKELGDMAAAKGLSFADLEAATGMKASTFANLFEGKFSPSLDVLAVLAKALDCKIVITSN